MKTPVAVLGATGSVGQRFVQLLDRHPWFEIRALCSSHRRVGQTYGESCRWTLSDPMPDSVRSMKLRPTTVEAANSPIVFSALPSQSAVVESGFARRGAAVFTNASHFRSKPDVPVLLPEINSGHFHLVDVQRQNRGWPGFIVANPNCTSTGIAVVLKALDDAFSVRRVFATSLQALSGAGYPGLSSMDLVDNLIPFIAGEEAKLEQEVAHLLGQVVNGSLEPSPLRLSAHCNRVPVSDGHTVCLSVEFARRPIDPGEAAAVLEGYRPPRTSAGLPSSPDPVISVRTEEDRPQPRLDRNTGQGMTTVVGRIRPDSLFHLKLVLLSHNTIRGAAGGSIFNAELALRERWVAPGRGLARIAG